MSQLDTQTASLAAESASNVLFSIPVRNSNQKKKKQKLFSGSYLATIESFRPLSDKQVEVTFKVQDTLLKKIASLPDLQPDKSHTQNMTFIKKLCLQIDPDIFADHRDSQTNISADFFLNKDVRILVKRDAINHSKIIDIDELSSK